MPSEKEKMLSGELYDASDAQLSAERLRARQLLHQLNASGPAEGDQRRALFQQLFGRVGAHFWLEPPFYCDYGGNILIGDNVFLNFNCVVLDVAQVVIGSFTMFGPNVQIYTATHTLDAATRRAGLELGKPITIGSDVWVGGGAVICPGVTIGSRSVIGAGSVVTRSIPDDVFAAGNPCRVIRTIDQGETR